MASTAPGVVGRAWIFDATSSEFVRKPEKRERVFYPSDRSTINVLPPEVDLDELVYNIAPQCGRVVADGKQFSLDISEFSAHR